MARSRDCRHGRQIGKCADCDLDHMEMAADAEARRVDELTAQAAEPVAWLDPWTGTKVTTDYDAYGKHGIPL